MSTRSCLVHVTIFSTHGKFRLVSNFMELHTLTLAARSYALMLGSDVKVYILNNHCLECMPFKHRLEIKACLM